MTTLAEEICEPDRNVGEPLSRAGAEELARSVPEWLRSDRQIEREFTFKDFREAMAFVNRVADLANEQDHHPDITILYNRVRLTLSTHKVGGLTRNDFILATKIDRSAEGAEVKNPGR